MRKWRKINGGVTMNREDIEQLKIVFKDGIVQPKWKDLGITESDFNADISLKDLITEYEDRYDEVELDNCDMETSFKNEYNCSKSTKNDLSPIILDFRNQNIVNLIKNSNDKKIVVIYGARHKKGIIKLMEEK